jgi:hypothetical protein
MRLLIYTRAFLDEVVKWGYSKEFEELLQKRGGTKAPVIEEATPLSTLLYRICGISVLSR